MKNSNKNKSRGKSHDAKSAGQMAAGTPATSPALAAENRIAQIAGKFPAKSGRAKKGSGK